MDLGHEEEEDWLDNIENMMPLRGGRTAAALKTTAHRVTVTDEEAEEKFRQDFAKALALVEERSITTEQATPSSSEQQEETGDDALGLMCQYTLWFDEHFPSGKTHLFFPICYRICNTFATIDRFRDDERLMKLWVRLADNFPERATAVMDFAYSKGSCRRLAGFYIRWSKMYEAMGWAGRAKEILALGFKNDAAPHEELQWAHEQLEKRIVLATQAVDSDMDQSDDEQPDSSRIAVSRLRGLGPYKRAPIMRRAIGPPGTVPATPVAQKTFEIFVEEEQPVIEEKPKRAMGSDIAQELDGDPDYQSLFGFFDDRSKADLQLSVKENLHTATKWT
ncbi:Mitotic checkpoint serine/threonine-protein kinase BUB1 beta, partial [Aphelenchoides avenae]